MKHEAIPYKIYLNENEMPKAWYNLRADMKNKPAPLLNPGTLQPMTAAELSGVFCEELVKQELDDTTPYLEIPAEIRDFYKMYRPSPLVRAYCLEEKLQTPAKIYYKFEGNNTSGSHKLNSAIAQAYYAKKQGLKGVTTETGAGQWGTALSMACSYFDLDCKVYMVKCSYEQKPFRREVMRTYGASVTPSPSMETEVGRRILAEHPGTTGSLGCAISEAVEKAVTSEGYRYVLGSVLNQVLLHQSVIGLETKAALDKYGIVPDMIIGCAGGGSNLGGLIAPFMGEKLRGERDYRIIAVEPASCPSFTRGKYAYDFCDTGKVCPLAKMYTLGSGYIPAPNHAGGLRYHGMSSTLSQLYDDGLMEARSYVQTDVFAAAEQFARVEGILPAPESSHAIRAAIDEAMKLYTNLRPARLYPALKEECPLRGDIVEKGFDLMMVRELTGGIYFGERGRRNSKNGREAYDIEAYSVMEIERIARAAFDAARKRRKNLISIDKANVLETSRLWRETVHRIAEEYPDVTVSDMLVDNAAMQLVRNPAQFDVVVTSNMFGDILSDEASQITGSIGLLPSASLGESKCGLYEPIHGSAPDIAGMNRANPLATILSAAMMLRYSFDLMEEADCIEKAVDSALNDGCRTADIIGNGVVKPLTCTEMTQAVLERI